MLIAHAPAGYIISKIVSRNFFKDSKLYICAGVLGAISSDLDVIYWEVVDNRSVNHHEYWTHIPHSWLPLIPVSIVLYFLNKRLSIATMFFTACVYLHLVLDSFLSGIKWHYPHSHEYTSLVDPKEIPVLVPYNEPFYTIRYGDFAYEIDGWVYNLAMHWTFQVEIVIVAASLIVFGFFFCKDIEWKK
jgi:inner membrane protein